MGEWEGGGNEGMREWGIEGAGRGRKWKNMGMREWDEGGNERMREWVRKENEGMGMGRRD